MTAGSRATISATMENPLLPGRYAIVCCVGVSRNDRRPPSRPTSSSTSRLRRSDASGIVSVPGEIGVSLDDRAGQRGQAMSADAEHLELRPVRGPSALGGGWKRFGELLYLISVTEFKRTYFGTVLGYVWSLLRPLLLFAVLLFVFTKIFRLGSNVPHYPVMLLMNVVLFGFFSEATGLR